LLEAQQMRLRPTGKWGAASRRRGSRLDGFSSVAAAPLLLLRRHRPDSAPTPLLLPPPICRSVLAEAVAAGAGARGVRVVDREALLLDGVDEVDRRAAQVRGAHPVRDDLDAVEVLDH